MSFYLAVPSDSSQKFFPNNKISSYTTKLAKEIILYDEYEIGLSTIHFPLSYYNVKKREFTIHKIEKSKKSLLLSVPEGRYSTDYMV